MSDLFEDMFDDVAALKSVNTETAKNLSSLVRDLRDVESRIEDVEQELKNLKQQKHAALLGMWVFIAQEVLFFGGLFASSS